MRYADGPTAEVVIDIAAPPERVWGLVSDITTPIAFSKELQAAEWLAPHDGPVLGARFRGTNAHPAIGEWQVECEVAWCEPGRTFGWTPMAGEQPLAAWRFTIDDAGDGSRLTFWARMGPGPSGLTPAIEAMPDKEEQIIERRLGEWRSNMEATVAGIKRLAEAG